MNYIKILIISIFLVSYSIRLYADYSVCDFNKDGASIETRFGYLDDYDIAYLYITIKDEKDFWMFDSLDKVFLTVYLDSEKKHYSLEIVEPETWVEDDRLMCSETSIRMSSDILRNILLANEISFGFEFVNIYVRRDYMSLVFKIEELDSWYSVCKGTNRPEKKAKTIFAIKLRDASGTVVALYKDPSLKNMTNLVTNGISADVIEFKTHPDGSLVYKVRVKLKDGSEHKGWVPESVISK